MWMSYSLIHLSYTKVTPWCLSLHLWPLWLLSCWQRSMLRRVLQTGCSTLCRVARRLAGCSAGTQMSPRCLSLGVFPQERRSELNRPGGKHCPGVILHVLILFSHSRLWRWPLREWSQWLWSSVENLLCSSLKTLIWRMLWEEHSWPISCPKAR